MTSRWIVKENTEIFAPEIASDLVGELLSQ